MARILLRFAHGLGDAVQFTVVLRHLKHLRSGDEFDIVSGRGKHTAFHGLCRRSFANDEPRPPDTDYAEVKTINWFENYNGYSNRPNSKITNCLAEEFNLPYTPELGSYQVAVSAEARARVAAYLDRLGCQKVGERYNVLVMHYEGNTSTEKKNLNHCHARVIARTAVDAGAKVILLDWDRRSPIPDDVNIHCPRPGPGDIWGGFGSGDAETVVALVAAARLFVGIDSGPGKCASATDTPSIIVWTGHHPLQFHDPSPHTLHLVHENHAGMPPVANIEDRRRYFVDHYQHATYTMADIGRQLHERVARHLGFNAAHPEDPTLLRHGGMWVRHDNFDQDCVILDDVLFGDAYRTSLYDLSQWDSVVDVGAHIGTFAKLVHLRNPETRIVCVEACPENLAALRANVGEFATVIHAAMTYQEGELALFNAVRPNCESTGGSVVVKRSDMDDPNHPLRQAGYTYWNDSRPLPKVNLEEVMSSTGLGHVTCLKLDCEGAEISILENTTSMSRIRFIFGEYHNSADWQALRSRKFGGWDYGVLHEADGRGNFHLVNPRYDPAPNQVVAFVPPIPAQKSEPRKADICDYYTLERAAAEITSWGNGTHRHQRNAVMVEAAAAAFGAKQVLEFASGAGQMASLLPAELDYLGVEPNDHFRGEAQKRFPTRNFVKGNLRDDGWDHRDTGPQGPHQAAPLVCAFAFLKHFSLAEWDEIAHRLFSMASTVVFDIQLGQFDHDDGVDFHHVTVTYERLRAALERAGLREWTREVTWQGMAGDRPMAEVAFVATRHSLDHVERFSAAPDFQAVSKIAKVIAPAGCVLVRNTISYGDAARDIAMAGTGAEVVAVSDFCPFQPGYHVTAAVRWFCITNPRWRFSQVEMDRATGQYLAILDGRHLTLALGTPDGRPLALLPEMGKTGDAVLRIALAGGIGDTAWVMTKLPALLKACGAKLADLETCGSDRAEGYLQKLPFVRSVKRCEWSIVRDPIVLPSGAYNYDPSQPGWHHHYDFFLQANGHLEEGNRLEDWFPELATDWKAPVAFDDLVQDREFARSFASRGPFVTVFAGPLDGNTWAGHNRCGKWTEENWTELAGMLVAKGLRVVLVGAGVGDTDYATTKLVPAGFFNTGAEDMIGVWDIGRTMAVLRLARAHVGYQSGLGVLSTYLGIPACMFWNEYGFPLNDAGCTFREEMGTAWVPPATLEAGRYKCAIYGRTSPAEVAEFVLHHSLNQRAA